jgi:hypothetical protein
MKPTRAYKLLILDEIRYLPINGLAPLLSVIAAEPITVSAQRVYLQ